MAKSSFSLKFIKLDKKSLKNDQNLTKIETKNESKNTILNVKSHFFTKIHLM